MEARTSIDILYDLVLDRLHTQITRVDGIDTKIGIVFGLANAVVGFLVVVLSSAVANGQSASGLVIALAILTAITYIATLVLLFFAYRWGKWSFNPEMKSLKSICTDPQYRAYPNVVKEWVTDECLRSLSLNRTPIANKVRLANWALVVVSIQSLFLVGTFIAFLVQQ